MFSRRMVRHPHALLVGLVAQASVVFLFGASACKARLTAPHDAGARADGARTLAPAALHIGPHSSSHTKSHTAALDASVAAAHEPRVVTVSKGQLGRFSKAAVASANPVASFEAARILAAGGNAMDAAVACALVLGVVEPHSAGIGGGGFLLHYDGNTRQVRALDYRERAPRHAHAALYRRDGGVAQALARDGPLAVAVPGTVAGLFEAHRAHGHLPWRRIVEPAARIADEGYEVQPRVAQVLRKRERLLRRYDASARMFFLEGRIPRAGERLRHPELAATLRAIGEQGPSAFYAGETARRIAAEIARGGGVLDAEDLRRYKPIWRAPIRGRFRGVELVAMPPPSSGGVILLQMLGMVERDDLAKMAAGARAHLFAEVMRRAYADRATALGDPDFVRVPTRALLDARYVEARRAQIDSARATPSARIAAGVPPAAESDHTTHVSVVDAMGNAVTLTQSINYLMGSGIVVPGTGILLNDTMDDFAIAPDVPNEYRLVGATANAIAPYKTPLSSMTPAFVLRGGKLWLALGSPGGSRIITTIFNVLVNRVVLRMDLAAAVDAARLHHQWKPDQIVLETKRPLAGDALVAGLRARGHRVQHKDRFCNVAAVEVTPDGARQAVADPRFDGAVAGY
jgi:gamma-glutamyltranspeptidase/glutathione hydrolase